MASTASTFTGSHSTHYAARSLIFAFPDSDAGVPKPLPFDKAKPFQNLDSHRRGGHPDAPPQ
jgi:hypothetical protein